eukprot:6765139-Alexandrium_andersonii.AAC.1
MWWRCSFTVWRKVSAHVKHKCTCALMQGAFRRLVYVSQHARTCPRQTDLRHLRRYRSGPNACVGKGDWSPCFLVKANMSTAINTATPPGFCTKGVKLQ